MTPSTWAVGLRPLGAYRILYAALTLLTMVPQAWWTGGLPDLFFGPALGPLMFLRGFPSEAALQAFNGLLVCSLLLLAAGIAVRTVSVATGLLLLLLSAWQFGANKLDHDILQVAVPLAMVTSGWGACYRLGRRDDPSQWDAGRSGRAVFVVALLSALFMLSGALPKLATGWLDTGTQAVRYHLVQNTHLAWRDTGAATFLLEWAPSWAWELLDWAVVLLESSILPALLLGPRLLRPALLLSAGFHAANAIILDIPFLENPLAYLLPVMAGTGLGSARTLNPSPTAAGRPPVWTLASVAVLTMLISLPRPMTWWRTSWEIEKVLTIGAGAAALAALAVMAGRALAGRRGAGPPAAAAGVPPLLLYDGSCGFCSWWVRQVLRRDRRRRFRFAALGSAVGRGVLTGANLPPDYHDSIVLRRMDGSVFTKSGAALRVAIDLGWPWRFLGLCLAVPRPARDAVYDLIARRRRSIALAGHSCPLPSTAEREQFL
ncbi:MAG: thiol-disulfide oxidoreductase DCC family protein [Gemmatimonadales bacterium]